MKSLLISLLLLIIFSAQSFALQFQIVNGSLYEFAEWVADNTHKNIVIGANVDGNISFYTRDLKEKDVLSFFEIVMNAYNYEVVQDGNSYSVVVPDKDEKNEGRGEEEDPDYLAKLYHLDNVLNSNIVQQIQFLVESLKLDARDSSVTLVSGNNLLVVAPEDIQLTVNDIIHEIDKKQLNLLVEAIIFEYQKSETNDTGFATVLGDSGDGPFTAFNSGDLVDLSVFPSSLVSGFIKANSFSALIHAIETNDSSKLLSTPKVLITEGNMGKINVGQNVPFVTGSTTVDADGGTSPYQTIERQDVGTILTITPKVLGPDLVFLDVYQESSNVTKETFASDIITNTRSVSTHVQVKPGQVIQLGGLVSRDNSDTKSHVPFFGKIPVIGRLFQASSKNDRQVELTVFLRVRFV